MKIELNQNLILKLAFSMKATAITNGKLDRAIANKQPCLITGQT